MKTTYILVSIYVVIIVVCILIYWKAFTRGWLRRCQQDVSRCSFGRRAFYPIEMRGDRGAYGCVSYSLYGNYQKYLPSLLGQLDEIPQELPDWQARVYLPADAPEEVIDQILARGGSIVLMNQGNTQEEALSNPRTGILGHEASLFRFIPAQEFRPFIVLDADDKLFNGIARKIRDWERSGRTFFIFKTFEIFIPIMAGRFGGRPMKRPKNMTQRISLEGDESDEDMVPCVPDMLERINSYCETWFGIDEAFLKKEIWPIMKRKGIYRTLYWPITELIIFAVIACLILSVITLRVATDRDSELKTCRIERSSK